MHTFVLQDWITIRGESSSGQGGVIIQTEREWLDLSPFQDVFAWVTVSEVTTGSSGRVDLYLDTSPTEDDALFQSMTGSTPTIMGLAASSTPTVVKLPMLSATVPLARFLRWRLVNAAATTAWDVTLRLVVAANSPGM